MLLCLLLLAPAAAHLSNITTRHIEVPLDHFDPNEKRTWNMMYYERLDLMKPGGPLILLIDDYLIPASKIYLASKLTFHTELAEKLGGGLFMSTQRYSQSSGIFSKKMRSVMYGGALQVIADQAALVRRLRADPRLAGRRVLAAGVAVGGAMAVWLRSKHPDLVDAAYASSAPLLSQVEFSGRLDAATDMLKRYGTPGCVEKVDNFFRYVDETSKTKEGRAKLKRELAVCANNDLEDEHTLNSFLEGMSMDQAFLITYWTPEVYCQKYWNETSLERHVNFPLNKFKDNEWITCTDYTLTSHTAYYFNTIMIDDIAITFEPGCKHYGLFDVPSETQLFSKRFNSSSDFRLCRTFFEMSDAEIRRDIERMGAEFGGLNPNVTRAVLVSGELDYGRGASITRDRGPALRARLMPHQQTAAELFLVIQNSEVRQTRQFILETLRSWLSD